MLGLEMRLSVHEVRYLLHISQREVVLHEPCRPLAQVVIGVRQDHRVLKWSVSLHLFDFQSAIFIYYDIKY